MGLILEVRQDARQSKDWETADKIRDQLEALNVELQDSRAGTTWRIIKEGSLGKSHDSLYAIVPGGRVQR